ncbi:unnamed protein product [Paramecium primaurelia]|uniref:Kinesin-like protein n=1 Tax=Paramecium primaurelia TaxID=5886 RepID=A0A8S1N720_PARPR|nr:unnamed protein product [Paramecium primaurelia]
MQQSKLNKSSLQQQSIKVYVRVRPLLKKELGQECIIKTDQQKYVVIEQSTHILKQEYDQVFDEKVSQAEIFKFISPTIHKALQGYNTTIMAYGQTGSGKTHTMFGSDWEYSLNISLGHQSTFIDDLQTDQNHAGMIPRTIYTLFNNLQQGYYVYCSFLQIYNEKIYDLLQDHKVPQALQIHESKTEGIYVEQLTEYAVNNLYDCLTLMKRGEKNRMIRQTTMNLKSSRSHTIFQLLIETSKADSGGQLLRSKINLCDLAGSEKINKQDSMTNAHLNELKSINQSLTTLGKVIQNLSQNNKNINKLPIPYRESKITRLLQDSLGGNTLTNIFVNVAPNIYNIDETANSLKFAQRARNITQIVQANSINATDQELVNKLLKEIDYLKQLLNMKRKGLNSNDIHFKLMKIQEENERLRQANLSVNEVEKLMQENRKMREELQKLQSQSHENSESSHLMKHGSEEGFSGSEVDKQYNTYQQTKLSNNGLLIVSNPSMQKTEVTVRYKDRGNKMQTKLGYVEASDQMLQREKRLMSERKRVIERLELLEQLQFKNNLNSSLPLNGKIPKPSKKYSYNLLNRTVEEERISLPKLKIAERKLIHDQLI